MTRGDVVERLIKVARARGHKMFIVHDDATRGRAYRVHGLVALECETCLCFWSMPDGTKAPVKPEHWQTFEGRTTRCGDKPARTTT